MRIGTGQDSMPGQIFLPIVYIGTYLRTWSLHVPHPLQLTNLWADTEQDGDRDCVGLPLGYLLPGYVDISMRQMLYN